MLLRPKSSDQRAGSPPSESRCFPGAPTITVLPPGRELKRRKQMLDFLLSLWPSGASFPLVWPDIEHFSWSSSAHSLCALLGFQAAFESRPGETKGRKRWIQCSCSRTSVLVFLLLFILWSSQGAAQCIPSRLKWEFLCGDRVECAYFLPGNHSYFFLFLSFFPFNLLWF